MGAKSGKYPKGLSDIISLPSSTSNLRVQMHRRFFSFVYVFLNVYWPKNIKSAMKKEIISYHPIRSQKNVSKQRLTRIKNVCKDGPLDIQYLISYPASSSRQFWCTWSLKRVFVITSEDMPEARIMTNRKCTWAFSFTDI